MMKPIYFPFTYIPESVAKPLSQFLGRIIVFQPVSNNQPEALHQLEENGSIEIRVPYSEDEDRLVGCLKEFKQWGRLHHGEEASLKDIFKNGFSNKTFTSQIRTDILKNQEDEIFDPDPVFLSRLFLLMAQELDLQQSVIDQKLASSIDDELDLFTSMTGEEKILDPPKESLFKNDYGAYMTGSRIAAWFRLMKNSAEESAFLVTNSQAVSDEIADHKKGLEMVFSFEGICCDQPEAVIKEFVQYLTHLATTPWSGPDQISLPDFNSEAGRKLNFKLYILPEVDPVDVCNFFLKDEILSKRNENSWLNTLFGFFEV
ncbi:MAG: hypothetical protein HF978_17490 [Desulfobacteraceae bacterium]|nr:hypothetical protein [Desulfobacteraceae bacterium]MBC2757340.1 hypothetical protein [Desulfobacteraceae bacterium]MBC2763946.1 hypothetical protein [ANME-2 cluster archaeon]